MGDWEDEDRACAINSLDGDPVTVVVAAGSRNSLAIYDNGLPSSCVLCSRLDHLFEPGASYRDQLCVAHVVEVSSLRYCGKHRRLVASSEMCDDCVPERAATEEQDLWCSCCGVEIENGLHVVFAHETPVRDYPKREGEYGGCRGRHHSLVHGPHNPLVCYLCQQPYIR